MNIAKRLQELAKNLYWVWHPEVSAVFRDLDPALWRDVNHNPVLMLSRLADAANNGTRPGGAAGIETRLTEALHHLRKYLEARDVWGEWYSGSLRQRPVAYLSAEFGLHESLPLYSGGLGVLSGDHLKAASDLAIPMIGIGLFYANGYFDQSLDRHGWQQEHYFSSNLESLPLSLVCDSRGQPMRVRVPGSPSEIQIQIWSARVGRNELLLLDSNVEGNSDFDRHLTAQLYGGDRTVRLRQEVILGIGGLRALKAMNIRPGVVHMNEGHSAFAVLELARQLMDRDGQPFQNVREMAAAMTVFTTHTPVEAGHDRFEEELIEQVLGSFRRQLALEIDDFMALGRADAYNQVEPFCMTILGLHMSRSRVAVSALHSRISRAMWRGLWPGKAEEEVPIYHITNGVHVSTWLSEPMRELYNRYLGPDWEDRMHDPRTWAMVSDIDDAEFWECDQVLRGHLVEYVRACVERQSKAREESSAAAEAVRQRMDPKALTIGFARRFALYKRGDLLFRNLNRLHELVNNPACPVQIILAGKAHPRDEAGKRTIQHVYQVTRDPRFAGKIIFLENYNMNVARHLVQGVDLWLNTPRRPLEACGTSGQKVAINAGLNLSVLDGWWEEAYDGRNGFAIGEGSEHSNWEKQDQIDFESMYRALEQEVVPLFYNRDAEGIPHGWIEFQKHALRTLAWRFSARRMILDYTLGCYLPAAGGLTASRPPVPFVPTMVPPTTTPVRPIPH